jgi:protein TonB
MEPVSSKRMETSMGMRSSGIWTVAVIASLILNMVLFGLMPRLIDNDMGRPVCGPCIEMVNVVRIKRPEPPARRKEKEEAPRPQETPKKLNPQKRVYENRPLKQVVDLPFEIKPKLPSISGTVPVLPMQMVSVGTPDLKGSYGVGEIDRPLTPLARVPPMYPMQARRRGIEGWVKVRFIVNEEGKVEDIRILESRPEKIFDEAVIRCVSDWRFTPGTVDGVPVKTWVKTTVQFDLQEESG